MHRFLHAALAFPTVLFGSVLLVVLAYWLFVLVGGFGADTHDGGVGIGAEAVTSAAGGAFAALRRGGVPIAVSLSLLVMIAWFLSLVTTVLVDGLPVRAALLPVVLVVAYGATRALLRPLRRLAVREEGITHAEFVGRVCVVRTGHVGPGFGQAEVAAPDGATALVQVRTVPGPLSGSPAPFGSGPEAPAAGGTAESLAESAAECAAESADGPGPGAGPGAGSGRAANPGAGGGRSEDGLTAGRTALIFDYDAEGGFFLVAPYDPPLR